MREVVWIAQQNGIRAPITNDIDIVDESNTVHLKRDGDAPRRTRREGLHCLTLKPEANQILEVPDHAKPAGFAGPVRRSGNVNEVAAGAVADLRRVPAAAALDAFAALSPLPDISSTAVS